MRSNYRTYHFLISYITTKLTLQSTFIFGLQCLWPRITVCSIFCIVLILSFIIPFNLVITGINSDWLLFKCFNSLSITIGDLYPSRYFGNIDLLSSDDPIVVWLMNIIIEVIIVRTTTIIIILTGWLACSSSSKWLQADYGPHNQIPSIPRECIFGIVLMF